MVDVPSLYLFVSFNVRPTMPRLLESLQKRRKQTGVLVVGPLITCVTTRHTFHTNLSLQHHLPRFVCRLVAFDKRHAHWRPTSLAATVVQLHAECLWRRIAFHLACRLQQLWAPHRHSHTSIALPCQRCQALRVFCPLQTNPYLVLKLLKDTSSHH
jgi:hypothetical protein